MDVVGPSRTLHQTRRSRQNYSKRSANRHGHSEVPRFHVPSLTSSGGWRDASCLSGTQGTWVWILLLGHFKAADLMASQQFLGAICSQVHVQQTATCSHLKDWWVKAEEQDGSQSRLLPWPGLVGNRRMLILALTVSSPGLLLCDLSISLSSTTYYLFITPSPSVYYLSVSSIFLYVYPCNHLSTYPSGHLTHLWSEPGSDTFVHIHRSVHLVENRRIAGQWWTTPLIPAPKRQRQVNLYLPHPLIDLVFVEHQLST